MDLNFNLQALIESVAEKAALKAVAQMGGNVKNTTETPKDGELLTKDQVKALCGNVSDMTLNRWSRSGYLPKTHIGRRVFYRVEDVNRLQKGGQA